MVIYWEWMGEDISRPDWTAQSNVPGAQFGSAVSTAGDVNGDGYADVVVGGELTVVYDGSGQASVYHGSPNGLSAAPDWTVKGYGLGLDLGSTVGGGGDVNGDGWSDVVVTADGYPMDVGGQALAFHGSAAGLDESPAWTVSSAMGRALFDHRGAIAGDVNGDGFDDVIVGATEIYETFHYYYWEELSSLALVYHGSPTGLPTVEDWSVVAPGDDLFGACVASAGDVNGDGHSDVIVGSLLGSNGEGSAWIFLGSTSGLESTPVWKVDSDQAGANLGHACSSAGDVDADGHDDVIVGAPNFDNAVYGSAGRAYLFLGSSDGTDHLPSWVVTSWEGGGGVGTSVAGAGDVDSDGFDDVVVGAPGINVDRIDSGAALVFPGSSAGLETTPRYVLSSDRSFTRFGEAVAMAGDVDGDGVHDVLVGAPNYDVVEFLEGRAFVYTDLCADSADLDGDGACAEVDCDDTNAAVFPGAPEVCDGLDTACAGSIPDDEIDADGDGESTCAGDCDDSDPARFSAQLEQCNGVDDDCDGLLSADEADADADDVSLCGGDCDDTSDRVGPDQPEVCGDGIDNDCDGVIDPDCGSDPDLEPGDDCSCSAGAATGAPLLALALCAFTTARRREHRARGEHLS